MLYQCLNPQNIYLAYRNIIEHMECYLTTTQFDKADRGISTMILKTMEKIDLLHNNADEKKYFWYEWCDLSSQAELAQEKIGHEEQTNNLSA